MIKTWTKPDRPNEESMKQRWDEKKKLLSAQQMKLKNHKLPVIVLMEGWGASGKGSTIRSIIDNLDPRFFKVTSMGKPTEEDQRRPFLYRYFQPHQALVPQGRLSASKMHFPAPVSPPG